MTEDFAQIHLAPLLRVEAMYLLGDTGVGFVICAKEGMTTRRPGIHAVERGAVVILALMTAELEKQLDDELPVTYLVEAVDEATGAGWSVSVTGPVEIVVDPVLRAHYRRTLPGFESDRGVRVLRLIPRLVDGHRFHRISAAL
ncbi:MAG: pyridoxamine 5'-phosphate oxidase family protein [Catenulispora sp.]|nr:pyridoxamine 5'-phosphate oxidase family protein [Catenulispora sp.]NUR60027.1 pyridoxamine 5'-phosphate oxidase family protein [Catenulispora sp.]